ncbi:uncharacterized protein LOC120779599 [Bactrocera tryoni]|uniref:uncharacterized protein LOC120779599 n=1 Tax=Bactrocera tryoni TaxID=59916 RepID=UPI001A976294|nr:uncharacterized protein LOC120779599 [Bactrocera tryoni]
MPSKIFSDNATNFVGADRKLRELKEAFLAMGPKLKRFAADEGCSFTFIPPRAPHFGGLWEAAVKSTKQHIVRVIGNALLTAATVLATMVQSLADRPSGKQQVAAPKRNMQLNDLVLVHEDNVPPQQWVLGRVVATVEGQDGKGRVADVATKAGTIKRPIHKLALLPLEIEGI